METDVRWIQRLNNFSKAVAQLVKFIDKGVLNEFEQQGLIQCFEYNYELAWNVIKDFYEDQGETGIQGSRDAFRLAYQRGLLENGDIWMNMIKSRIMANQTFDEDTTNSICTDIRNSYYQEFLFLERKLIEIKNKE